VALAGPHRPRGDPAGGGLWVVLLHPGLPRPAAPFRPGHGVAADRLLAAAPGGAAPRAGGDAGAVGDRRGSGAVDARWLPSTSPRPRLRRPDRDRRSGGELCRRSGPAGRGQRGHGGGLPDAVERERLADPLSGLAAGLVHPRVAAETAGPADRLPDRPRHRRAAARGADRGGPRRRLCDDHDRSRHLCRGHRYRRPPAHHRRDLLCAAQRHFRQRSARLAPAGDRSLPRRKFLRSERGRLRPCRPRAIP
jgi:hypothetical protein